jgi:WhiB family redox-sensing transcriptional regulator
MNDETIETWMAHGACRAYPPNTFFPSDGVGVDRARKICATCSVTAQCLEYALTNHIDHGVWGGCSERERRRINKRRRLTLNIAAN